MRAIGMDPVADTQTCFRALVDVTSRPGTVREAPIAPADHAVLATLVDHEVTCHTPDEGIRTALADEGRLATAPPEEADVVHAPEPTAARVAELRRGTLKEPSEGATIVYRVDGLETAPGDGRDWTRLALSGPGVPGERTLGVDGFPAAAARALADAQSTYPRGVDAVFATAERLAAVPRSVSLEVA